MVRRPRLIRAERLEAVERGRALQDGNIRARVASSLGVPEDIGELAIGHQAQISSHRRSDALEKRRKLMEAWADYCEPGAKGKVVRLGRKTSWT